MGDPDRKCLGRSADGNVKNDKVEDLAGADAVAVAPLHFGNAALIRYYGVARTPKARVKQSLGPRFRGTTEKGVKQKPPAVSRRGLCSHNHESCDQG